jgi:hypothetical protein
VPAAFQEPVEPTLHAAAGVSPVPAADAAFLSAVPAPPDMRPALPDMRPALPDMRPALPDMRPALPDMRPALPDMRPALPGQLRRQDTVRAAADGPSWPELAEPGTRGARHIGEQSAPLGRPAAASRWPELPPREDARAVSSHGAGDARAHGEKLVSEQKGAAWNELL